tara:strand:- start:178 stop:645 length:468 start_codon:yes stop_codon:yes gene_type:complete
MPIATNSEKIDISLEDNIAELAKKFSQILKKGDVVFLHGEIGVGKTTFVKHLINNFQRKKNLDLTEVTSPTFNLVNEYNGGNFIIQHYDLFRLKSIEEIKNLDIFEDISNTIILIEWPELIKKKPKNLIELILKYEDDHKKRSAQIHGLDLKLFK